MKCKFHPFDHSSAVGVCASCLREKLIPLLAHQSPPLIFPRSISPPPLDRDPNPPTRLFFSTPQLGPTGSILIEPARPRGRSRFSLLSNLFRSRSEQIATSSSPSWLSNLFSGRKKKQQRMSSVDESTVSGRRGFPGRGRGMSPARVSDCGTDGEFDFGGSSGYSSVRQTPLRAVPARRSRGGRLRSDDVAGFCLSPLVWPTPRRQWNQTPTTPEVTNSAGKSHLSTTASFCKNRSRKIADFGRFDRRQ